MANKTSSPLFAILDKLIIAHPILVLLMGAVVTVFFGSFIGGFDFTAGGHRFQAPGIKFSSSSDEFFIKGDPDKQYYEEAKKRFGNDQVIVVAMIAPEGQDIYTPERLTKLKRLTDRIALCKSADGVQEVDKTVSLMNVPSIRAPKDPATGEYLKEIAVKPLIPRIPQTPAEWGDLKAMIAQNKLYQHNLVAVDGQAAAVVAFIHDFEDQTNRYDETMQEVKRILQEESEAPGGERIVVCGIPESRVEMVKRMNQDLKIFLPLTFALIVVTLTFNFRKFQGVFLAMVGVVITSIWSLGFMGLAGVPINMVTLVLPPLLLSLGSAYAIYTMSGYLAEVREELNEAEIIREMLGKGVMPIMVTALINVFGFASLLLNNIPAIQELGFASTVGIFFAMVVAVFILPAILRLMKKPKAVFTLEGQKSGGNTFFDKVLDRLPRLIIRRRRTIFAVAIILVIVSSLGILGFKFGNQKIGGIVVDTDFLHFFADDDPVMEAVNLETKHLAGAAPFNIVIEAPGQPGTFKRRDMLMKIEELQDWMVKNVKGIDTTISIVDYFKLFNQAYHQNDPASYQIPDSQLEVAQRFEFFRTSAEPGTFDPYVTSDYDAVNILIRSRLVGSSETNRAIKAIEAKTKELFQPPKPKLSAPVSHAAAAQGPVTVQAVPPGEESVDWGGRPPTPSPAPPGPPPAPVAPEDTVNWGQTPSEKPGATPDPPAGAPRPDPPAPAAGTSSAAPAAPVKEDEVNWGDHPAPSPRPAPAAAAPSAHEPTTPWPQVDVHVTGTIYLMNKSADAVSSGQVSGFSTALGTVFLTMAVLFLSLRIGFLAILPNVVPIFILFGIMGFSGITLNFSTALIASIALGLGIDDTIHYIHHFNHEVKVIRDQNQAMINTLKEMGLPMIYTSIALVLGFAILTLSDFVPIRQFGLLTAAALACAITSNLILLPSLMLTVRFVTLWELLDLEIGDNPSRYIKIFHGLSDHQAKVAVLMGHVAEFQDGQTIIKEGDMGNEMFVILKGYVNIMKGEGEHSITLATIQPGDAFGEMALLRHTTRSATAKAQGRVKLFVLDEQVLHRLQRRYPKISSHIFYNITQILSDRLQAATSQVVEYTTDLQEMRKQEK